MFRLLLVFMIHSSCFMAAAVLPPVIWAVGPCVSMHTARYHIILYATPGDKSTHFPVFPGNAPPYSKKADWSPSRLFHFNGPMGTPQLPQRGNFTRPRAEFHTPKAYFTEPLAQFHRDAAPAASLQPSIRFTRLSWRPPSNSVFRKVSTIRSATLGPIMPAPMASMLASL